jgi:hypothetical protein
MNRQFALLSLATAIAIIAVAAFAPTASAQCPDGCHGTSIDGCNHCGGHFGGGNRGLLNHDGLGCCCLCDGSGCDSTCCYCQFGDCGYMLPARRARWYNWNRNYAHTDYGQPVALVVPPTANMQTNYGWGVASSRLSRIEHQFQRNFPGYGMFGGPFRPTPVWPSDTTQFGVYYVRGPR